jgi:hypothetical protein
VAPTAPRRIIAGTLGGLLLAAAVYAFAATLPVTYRAEATVDVRDDATPDLLPSGLLLLGPRTAATIARGDASFVPHGAAQFREIAGLAGRESGIRPDHLLRLVRVADSKSAPPSFDLTDMGNRRLTVVATSSKQSEVQRAANVFAANLISYRRRQYTRAFSAIARELRLRASAARRQRQPASATALLTRLERANEIGAFESKRLALTMLARRPGAPESPRPWRDAAVAFAVGFLACFFGFPMVQAALLRRRSASTELLRSAGAGSSS